MNGKIHVSSRAWVTQLWVVDVAEHRGRTNAWTRSASPCSVRPCNGSDKGTFVQTDYQDIPRVNSEIGEFPMPGRLRAANGQAIPFDDLMGVPPDPALAKALATDG